MAFLELYLTSLGSKLFFIYFENPLDYSIGSTTNRKVVGRSASDASSKKSKRPSIFNFFSSKKNEYNLDEEERKKDHQSSASPSGGKRVSRSKSDVGSSSGGSSGGSQSRDFRKGSQSRHKNSDSDEGITDRMKRNPQLSPIIEDHHHRDDYFEEKKTGGTSHQLRNNKKIPIGKTYSSENEDLDLIPSKISKSTNLESILNRSSENMHSSQLPAEKPPLTKGVKVPSMVKRLSMEKLSPPPTSDAFTYISPSSLRKDDCPDKKIIYAEVVCGKNNKSVDEPDFVNLMNYTTSNRHNEDDFETKFNRQQSPAEQFASKYKTSHAYSNEKIRAYDDGDDVILPKIRDLPPEKPTYAWASEHIGRRGQADGKEHYPEFNDLSNRREELYSRIKSRINREPVELVVDTKRNLLKEFDAVPPPPPVPVATLPVEDTLVSRKQVENHRQVHTRRRYEFTEPVLRNRSPSPYHIDTNRHFSPAREISTSATRETFSPEKIQSSPIRDPSPYGKRHFSKESQRDRGEEEVVTMTSTLNGSKKEKSKTLSLKRDSGKKKIEIKK